GAFPLWLSPVQVKILTINDSCMDYAKKVKDALSSKDIRVEIDIENNTISKKIREAEMNKIPYILVIGEKEKKENSISVRKRTEGNKGEMSLNSFVEKIEEEIKSKK
ncbi:MAG: His/Gly/Thr/Pro-type tRNA ligase C-terminal domain-containing protein, partial [Candidatus Pacebacteria bacterium]|nr:His/Gly/Thr/Pro-type tRNA ligase C-terminal domain-containing protein [Candidatus Paceibacterota bacterium]MDD4897110.1 His/Gly/Thr/Pro-type tRNA ligase C-terminal domain-containing protein [Candidatus Paceibacterota bacterium]